jgi:DNA-binding beta-propeller fold protein YncE
VVRAQQGNPFWLSPIFTPDGRLLYLHQWPGFGDTMQVVDLTSHRLLGPVPTPTDQGHGGPFPSLVTEAHAGGVASTTPVSPDGLKLYSATDDGVMVLRIPDLAPVTRLARGVRAGEVWISGDGQTIYVTADDGKRLVVMRSDGSEQRSLTLPGTAGGFLASEHG